MVPAMDTNLPPQEQRLLLRLKSEHIELIDGVEPDFDASVMDSLVRKGVAQCSSGSGIPYERYSITRRGRRACGAHLPLSIFERLAAFMDAVARRCIPRTRYRT